jgi:hypothetical protein
VHLKRCWITQAIRKVIFSRNIWNMVFRALPWYREWLCSIADPVIVTRNPKGMKCTQGWTQTKECMKQSKGSSTSCKKLCKIHLADCFSGQSPRQEAWKQDRLNSRVQLSLMVCCAVVIKMNSWHVYFGPERKITCAPVIRSHLNISLLVSGQLSNINDFHDHPLRSAAESGLASSPTWWASTRESAANRCRSRRIQERRNWLVIPTDAKGHR